MTARVGVGPAGRRRDGGSHRGQLQARTCQTASPPQHPGAADGPVRLSGRASRRRGVNPSGERLMAHWHHEDRVYTVISGVFYIGRGDEFDENKLEAYPPGAVVVLPGGTSHFHSAKSGEYVTQVTAIGPISLDYVDTRNDPRNT
jgi:hypothetical protein